MEASAASNKRAALMPNSATSMHILMRRWSRMLKNGKQSLPGKIHILLAGIKAPLLLSNARMQKAVSVFGYVQKSFVILRTIVI